MIYILLTAIVGASFLTASTAIYCLDQAVGNKVVLSLNCSTTKVRWSFNEDDVDTPVHIYYQCNTSNGIKSGQVRYLGLPVTYGTEGFTKPIGALSCHTLACYDDSDDLITKQALSNTCYYEEPSPTPSLSSPLPSGINSGSGDTSDSNETMSTTTTTTATTTIIATTTTIIAKTTASFYDTTMIKPTVTPIKYYDEIQFAFNLLKSVSCHEWKNSVNTSHFTTLLSQQITNDCNCSLHINHFTETQLTCYDLTSNSKLSLQLKLTNSDLQNLLDSIYTWWQGNTDYKIMLNEFEIRIDSACISIGNLVNASPECFVNQTVLSVMQTSVTNTITTITIRSTSAPTTKSTDESIDVITILLVTSLLIAICTSGLVLFVFIAVVCVLIGKKNKEPDFPEGLDIILDSQVDFGRRDFISVNVPPSYHTTAKQRNPTYFIQFDDKLEDDGTNRIDSTSDDSVFGAVEEIERGRRPRKTRDSGFEDEDKEQISVNLRDGESVSRHEYIRVDEEDNQVAGVPFVAPTSPIKTTAEVTQATLLSLDSSVNNTIIDRVPIQGDINSISQDQSFNVSGYIMLTKNNEETSTNTQPVCFNANRYVMSSENQEDSSHETFTNTQPGTSTDTQPVCFNANGYVMSSENQEDNSHETFTNTQPGTSINTQPVCFNANGYVISCENQEDNHETSISTQHVCFNTEGYVMSSENQEDSHETSTNTQPGTSINTQPGTSTNTQPVCFNTDGYVMSSENQEDSHEMSTNTQPGTSTNTLPVCFNTDGYVISSENQENVHNTSISTQPVCLNLTPSDDYTNSIGTQHLLNNTDGYILLPQNQEDSHENVPNTVATNKNGYITSLPDTIGEKGDNLRVHSITVNELGYITNTSRNLPHN